MLSSATGTDFANQIQLIVTIDVLKNQLTKETYKYKYKTIILQQKQKPTHTKT